MFTVEPFIVVLDEDSRVNPPEAFTSVVFVRLTVIPASDVTVASLEDLSSSVPLVPIVIPPDSIAIYVSPTLRVRFSTASMTRLFALRYPSPVTLRARGAYSVPAMCRSSLRCGQR